MKEKYIWGFQIASPDCGRDITGTFHCVCGECMPLRVNVSEGGKYRGDDSGDGRYKGEKHIDFFPPFGTPCP